MITVKRLSQFVGPVQEGVVLDCREDRKVAAVIKKLDAELERLRPARDIEMHANVHVWLTGPKRPNRETRLLLQQLIDTINFYVRQVGYRLVESDLWVFEYQKDE